MNERIDVQGWLQDVATRANAILNGLHDGTIPDLARVDDDWDMQASLKSCFADMDRYERACRRQNSRITEDMGPSQANRL